MTHPFEPRDNNRVLTGLPARLEAAKTALREHEKTLEQLRQLYGHRLLLKDSVVLDQIGELLGCPKIEGDESRCSAVAMQGTRRCVFFQGHPTEWGHQTDGGGSWTDDKPRPAARAASWGGDESDGPVW